MSKVTRAVFVAVVGVVTTVLLAGCSYIVPSVFTGEEGASTDSVAEETMQYLSSDERSDQYRDIVNPIATDAVNKLLAGSFGELSYFDDYNEPTSPNYKGWGTLSAQNDVRYIAVKLFLSGDGSVDLSQGIYGVALDSGDSMSGVYADAPTETSPEWWVRYDRAHEYTNKVWIVNDLVGSYDDIVGMDRQAMSLLRENWDALTSTLGYGNEQAA